ncbi:hypothetical protein IBX38_09530, partial [Candidatus Bathyarchaeota archaeon]|nr:hypothetical protein [Candidatus Bathyarchaeota archaeon]
MLHENDHYKEKDRLRLRSFTLHHRIIMLLVLVWKWWDTGVFTNQDMFSALQASLSTEYADMALGIGIKPMHYAIFGIMFVIIGSVILIARREKVTVTEEATVMLECPYCKHRW